MSNSNPPFDPLEDRVSFLETELQETRDILAKTNELIMKLADTMLAINQTVTQTADKLELVRQASMLIAEGGLLLEKNFNTLRDALTDDGK